MPATIDTSTKFKGQSLVGKKFGRWTVLKYHGVKIYESGNRAHFWECLCSCGNTKIVMSSNLVSGGSTACGCHNRGAHFFKHGFSKRSGKHPMNMVYHAMRARCTNPKNKDYKHYGGRGIKCLWTDFLTFYNDMSPTYAKGLMIDRKDNSGDYCKDNCRWVDRSTQMNNRRNNVLLTHNDQTHTLTEWSRITGIGYKTLTSRIKRLGWSTNRALTTP